MLDHAQGWPPDYVAVFAERQRSLVSLARATEKKIRGVKEFYRSHPAEFIEDWGTTYDSRNAGTPLLTYMPFVMFKRQRELVEFLMSCVNDEQHGLIEKCRDMGATWVCCGLSVWMWLFWHGAAIGWGSRKSDLVDKIGVADSIFEKMRIFIRRLPQPFLPRGFDPQAHLAFMKFVNPENESTISGESGDNVGRGGRTRVMFKDESAHYERPELIEAALESNTRVQIDISSVTGLGTVFHRKRESGVDWEPGKKIASGKIRVFVMDWRDHPTKTQEWYNLGRSAKEAAGLLHIWAQEVDRDYASAVEGVIILHEWVLSAIDAHKKLADFGDDGGWAAGLDVADEGGDMSALALRKGVVLKFLDEWGDRDTGSTARRAVGGCRNRGPIELQYDSIGVGAGVKAETNRLREENLLPRDIWLVPWNAGAEVLDPEKRVIPGDRQSPTNEDFYQNLSAQAAWQLRRRFELTHRAVTDPDFTWDPEDLISIDSEAIGTALLRKLEKELCQPTAGLSTKMKMLINKKPDGARSPNLFDAVKMCYWPVPSGRPMFISADVMKWAGQKQGRR